MENKGVHRPVIRNSIWRIAVNLQHCSFRIGQKVSLCWILNMSNDPQSTMATIPFRNGNRIGYIKGNMFNFHKL